MGFDYKVRIREDRTVEWHGIDFELGSKRAKLVTRRKSSGGEFLVVHIPGHPYWASIGHQGYAPAEFRVFKVVKTERNGVLVLNEIVTFPARKKRGV